MAREYFCAYHSYLEAVEPLSEAERGRLFTACLEYSRTGAEPELRGNERFVFPTIKAQIDRDNGRYAVQVAANADNGRKGGRPKKANKTENNRNNPMGFEETEKSQGEGKGKGKDKENKEPPKSPLQGDGGDNNPNEPKKSRKETAEQKKSELNQIFGCLTADFTADLKTAAKNWIVYKGERNESYKPQGLKSLLTEMDSNRKKHGESAVIGVINRSMGNNWKGIIWDKLEQGGAQNGGNSGNHDKNNSFKPKAGQERKSWSELIAEDERSGII